MAAKKKTTKQAKKKTVTKHYVDKSKKPKYHIVKRHGHTEHYDEKKVYASVYSAAINSHYTEQKAEKLAAQVMKKVSSAILKKGVVSSSNIRDEITRNITDHEVAIMYKHHLDIC